MSYVNYEDTQLDVVSTIAPVMLEWMNQVSIELGGEYVVMEPSMEYEPSIEEIRKKNNMLEKTPSYIMPFLSFTRTALRQMEGTSSRRLTTAKALERLPSSNDVKIYSFAQCTFDLEFVYYANNLAEIETFEIAYNTEKGLPGIRKLEVDIPDLYNTFTYYTRWRELGNLDFQKENNQFVSISGSVEVSGFFLNYQTTQGKILDINLAFYEQLHNKLLEENTIN